MSGLYILRGFAPLHIGEVERTAVSPQPRPRRRRFDRWRRSSDLGARCASIRSGSRSAFRLPPGAHAAHS